MDEWESLSWIHQRIYMRGLALDPATAEVRERDEHEPIFATGSTGPSADPEVARMAMAGMKVRRVSAPVAAVSGNP